MNDSNGPISDHFLNPERAERELQAVERAIAEEEERLRRLEANHTSFLTVVYNRFTSIHGMPTVPSGRRSREEYDALNDALNPYWLPEVLQRRSEWTYSRRTDKYRKPWNPEYPPEQWQGSLVVASVEPVTYQREAVFSVYVSEWRYIGGGYEDYRVPFSFEGRVERYTPTGNVSMSEFEKALNDASAKAAGEQDACATLLAGLFENVRALIAPLRKEVVLTFHPDLHPNLGQGEDEEQLRIHGCDYRNIKHYRKNVKSYLKWPPLTRYEAPKVGERFGLASYKGICWVCHGWWEPHQFPQETLTQVWDGIERIARPLFKQLAESGREITRCRQEIVLLRRRRGKLATLYLQPPLLSREEWDAAEKRRAASGSGVSVSGQLQIPQAARSLPGRETRKEETK